jgi:tetratricopeptide (TPR) repeat protein
MFEKIIGSGKKLPSPGNSGTSSVLTQNAESHLIESPTNKVLENFMEALRDFLQKQKSPKKSFFNTLADLLDTIRRILISILIIILFIVFARLIYEEFSRDAVVIEVIEVPEELQALGFTNRAMANRLLDQINLISEKATSTREARQFLTIDAIAPIEAEIPGAGLSLKSTLRSLKELYGYPPIYITGEVTQPGAENQLYVTIRVVGKSPKTISGTLTSLDSTLLKAAEHIYEQTDPFTLAAYLKNDDQSERSINTIRYIVDHEPLDDDPWAYNLWGIILSNQKDYAGAITKYQKAIILAPEFALPYCNRGLAYSRQGNLEAAITDYDKAIELNSEHATSYLNRGIAHFRQGNLEAAITDYDKAIELKPKYDIAYFDRGLAYSRQGNKEAAIADFQKVYELSTDLDLRQRTDKQLKTLGVEQKAGK